MLDAALILSGGLMGLAGVPHCLAMCGAASAAALGRCGAPAARTRAAFHLGRVAGYAAAGALAAGALGALQWLGQTAPVLHPLWTLWHAAALALGVWLWVRGR